MSAKRELAELRENFEARVVAKVRLIMQATQISPNTCFDAAWPDEQIRARAVSDRMGATHVDGRSEAYIEARFDVLAEERPMDPVVYALAYRVPGRHH